MAKNLMSFADLTIPGSGWDIMGSMTRKSAAPTDLFKGKLRFNAVIIKTIRPTQPFTAKETASRTGQPQDGATEGPEPGLYGYRVRIVDDYSPHAFLPDPCDPQISGSANALLMDMHTLAYSKYSDFHYGDQVIIQLDKSDFSYNLDYAEIVERIYVNKERFAQKKECSQPMDYFAKMGNGIPGTTPLPLSKNIPISDMTITLPGGWNGKVELNTSCDSSRFGMINDASRWKITEYHCIKIYTDLRAPWTSRFPETMIQTFKNLQQLSPGSYRYAMKNIDAIFSDDSLGTSAAATLICGMRTMLIGEDSGTKPPGIDTSAPSWDSLWMSSVLIHEAEHLEKSEAWGYEHDSSARTSTEMTAIAKQIEFLRSLSVGFGQFQYRANINHMIDGLLEQDGTHWKKTSTNDRARKQYTDQRDSQRGRSNT